MNWRFFEMFIISKQLKLISVFLSIFYVSDSIQKSSIDFKQLKFMLSSSTFRAFSLVISFLVTNWSTSNEIRSWLKIIIKIKDLNLLSLIIWILECWEIISLFFFVSILIISLISSSLSLSFFMILSEKLSWFSWSRNVKSYINNKFNKQRNCFHISWTYTNYNMRSVHFIDNLHRISDSAEKKSDYLQHSKQMSLIHSDIESIFQSSWTLYCEFEVSTHFYWQQTWCFWEQKHFHYLVFMLCINVQKIGTCLLWFLRHLWQSKTWTFCCDFWQVWWEWLQVLVIIKHTWETE